MCCLQWPLHLVSIRANKLVGSGPDHPQDSIWPFSVRPEHSLGRILGTMIHLPKHPIACPQLPFLHFSIDRQLAFSMLASSSQLASPSSSIFSRGSHSPQSAQFGVWLPLSPQARKFHVQKPERIGSLWWLFYETLVCL